MTKHFDYEADVYHIPQAKMLRIMQIIGTISHTPLKIDEIAALLEVSERTAYRYISMIGFMEVPVKAKERHGFGGNGQKGNRKIKRYYLEVCPFCKKPTK